MTASEKKMPESFEKAEDFFQRHGEDETLILFFKNMLLAIVKEDIHGYNEEEDKSYAFQFQLNKKKEVASETEILEFERQLEEECFSKAKEILEGMKSRKIPWETVLSNPEAFEEFIKPAVESLKGLEEQVWGEKANPSSHWIEVDSNSNRLKIFSGSQKRKKLAEIDYNIANNNEKIEKQLRKLIESKGSLKGLDNKKIELKGLSRDLLNIAAVVYFADKHTKGDRQHFKELNIRMGVVKNLWTRKEVRRSLEDCIEFLTGYKISFTFEKIEEYTYQDHIPPTYPPFDCVASFSGGIDSFSGSVFLDRKEKPNNPLFVSHASRIPSAAIRRLTEKWGKKRYVKVSIDTRPRKSESTLSARSFLYLSLSCVFAFELNIEKVFIFENGVLGFNVPMNEGRYTTKSVNPKFLEKYQKMIEMILNADKSENTPTNLKIENPFITMTKGEVVELLVEGKQSRFLTDTVSCWAQARVKTRFPDATHCGMCFPCIVRRISVLSNNLKGINEKIGVDVFGKYPEVRLQCKTDLLDLMRFSVDLLLLKETEIAFKYPSMFSYSSLLFKNEDIYSLFKRFAKEVEYVIDTYGSQQLKEDFSQMKE